MYLCLYPLTQKYHFQKSNQRVTAKMPRGKEVGGREKQRKKQKAQVYSL